MRPLQIWLPELCANLNLVFARKDSQRAYTEWNGEAVIWLIPGRVTPRRWRDRSGLRSLAIGAEDVERIEILHVGENGFVVGPSAQTRFPQAQTASLVDAWLNLPRMGPECMYPVGGRQPVLMPRFDDKTVTYVEREIEISPRYTAPAPEQQDPSKARMVWPAESFSRKILEEGQGEARHDRLYAVPESDAGVACLAYRFPDPIGPLMPLLSWTPELQVRKLMIEVARLSRTDLERARIDATRLAGDYISEGTTTIEAVEFNPILAKEGEAGLQFYLENRYGIEADKQSKTEKEKLQKLALQKVPVRKVWGPLGLFWALLLDELESHRAYGVCERCGRLINARKNKRFCGKIDSLECFVARHAAEQRRSRDRKRKPRKGGKGA